MNEIKKLHENANIKICKRKQGFTLKDCTDRDCKECGYYVMPPFTAEKQLNLVILLANREVRISPTYICSGYYLNDLNKIKSSRNISTFENSLAQHVNTIWQDLTEEEKQQIKEILERVNTL